MNCDICNRPVQLSLSSCADEAPARAYCAEHGCHPGDPHDTCCDFHWLERAGELDGAAIVRRGLIAACATGVTA